MLFLCSILYNSEINIHTSKKTAAVTKSKNNTRKKQTVCSLNMLLLSFSFSHIPCIFKHGFFFCYIYSVYIFSYDFKTGFFRSLLQQRYSRNVWALFCCPTLQYYQRMRKVPRTQTLLYFGLKHHKLNSILRELLVQCIKAFEPPKRIGFTPPGLEDNWASYLANRQMYTSIQIPLLQRNISTCQIRQRRPIT